MSDLLFVYGTLRAGCDTAMARWLNGHARHVGRATAAGALYRVDYYPAFVPGEDSVVVGDLFALVDPAAMLARLDAYEECSADFPPPHEYRREQMMVSGTDGVVRAWTYVYGWDVAGLERIGSGDFLAG